MSIPLPATKLNEVLGYFGTPGLKDLKPFSSTGKKKTELKKAMMDLMSAEPVKAHTGLGAIYIYENLHNLALSEFKKAYEKSFFGSAESFHYANALFIYGNQDDAVKIYMDLIKNNRNDAGLFSEAIKRFSDYCYIDELKEAMTISHVSRNLTLSNKKDIQDAYDISAFLGKHNISVKFYRELKNSMDKVFYEFFSLPSQTEIYTCIDDDLGIFTTVLNIDSNLLEDPYQSVGEMNDLLQDYLVDFYEKKDIKTDSNEDKITVYFGIKS